MDGSGAGKEVVVTRLTLRIDFHQPLHEQIDFFRPHRSDLIIYYKERLDQTLSGAQHNEELTPSDFVEGIFSGQPFSQYKREQNEHPKRNHD